MPLASKVDPRSPQFARRRARMLERIRRVRDAEAQVAASGERACARFEAAGRLPPRARIARLLDPGRPFLELAPLAGYGMHDDDGRTRIYGGGNICGIGFIEGVRCMVVANDSTIQGGTIRPMGLAKTLRAQHIAFENRLPTVYLVESGGANLLHQAELFVEGGRVFRNMARASAAGLPQISVVHGSSTAGGAYLPGLSDYVIMVRGHAKVFLAGPPLVRAAIGEEADEQELGGAQMHFTRTGTAEYLADDDAHAVELARTLVAHLGWHVPPAPPAARPPRYDPDELCGVVPADPAEPFDIREVIARVVDASDFFEFKAGYGTNTVCGHAAVEGHPCGIVGNNGPLAPEDSTKVAHFIQLCCQSGTPLVYLQNTTGYMVGTAAEQAGAVKHGSKMIQAVANATVPQLTLIVGGGYGAGYYGMCGRSFDPRFLFAWPSAKVAVMGGAQAAEVMEIVTRAKMARKGTRPDPESLAQMGAFVRKKLEEESSPFFATARLWDDGILDPRDSRRVLGFCLATCRDAERVRLRPNTFGVARM